MARIFTCGFEENNLAEAMGLGTAGNAPTIGSTAPHSGTYRMNTSAIAGNSYVNRTIAAAKTSGSIFTRFYFRADDATPTATNYIFRWLSSGNVPGPAIQLQTDGTLLLLNEVAVTQQTGAIVLSNNTWYRIEHKAVLSDTVGEQTVLLYDDANALLETIQLGAANEDTLPTNYLTVRFGKTGSASIFSFDDLAINDSVDPGDGSQMTYPGIGKIYMLVPDSDVSITYEDSAGGTNNATFANIDDFPGANDETNYNASDSTLDAADNVGDIDRFGLTNLGAEVTANATITLADVYGRVGSNQTSASHIRCKLWDESGTLTNGPTCTVNVNAFRFIGTNEHLVYNAAGKTKANFDSFNVGYETFTDTIVLRPRRVSALWVNVEWTEAVSAITTEYVGPTTMQRQGGVMIGRRYV